MAIAEVQRKAETYVNSDATAWRHEYSVAFYGADVPGGLQFKDVSINTDASTVLSTIPALIGTAVRAVAIVNGWTVPANKVLLPTYGVV